MKTLILVIIILAAICCLQNCKQDPCKGFDRTPSRTVHDIPLADKSKIPYTGTDTLVYYSDAGDIATLYGSGKNVYYQTVKGSSGTSDCYREVESLYQHIDFDFEGRDSFNIIKYHIEYDILNGSYILYSFNKYEDGIYTSFISTPSLYNDSIVINGKYYPGKRVLDTKTNYLYNYKYGFLQINIYGEKTWTLNIK